VAWACAWGAGVAGFAAGAEPAAWPIAAIAKLRIVSINSVLKCVMKFLLQGLVTEKTITEQAEAAHLDAWVGNTRRDSVFIAKLWLRGPASQAGS